VENPTPRILIVGTGDLAGQVLYQLAREARAITITVGGRKETELHPKVNLARLAAVQVGHQPTINGVQMDLNDVDAAAQVIDAVDPDVIFNTASMQSWWVIGTLPKKAFQAVYRANFGPWLPVHLTPVLHLMRAVRLAGSRAVVVNAAYPDAVHPVLQTAGITPDVGIGNVANNIPALRLIAADRLQVPLRDVKVRLVAHHFVSHHVSRTGHARPDLFRLEVTTRGEDRTSEIDVGSIFAPLTARYRRLGGVGGQVMTASSAVSVLRPLLHGDEACTHAPGVRGLPGGYPVRISGGSVNLDLPLSLTVEEAIAINQAGQRLDGIEKIHSDGTVEFTEQSAEIMTETLGYECRSMRLGECDERANELVSRYRDYAARNAGRVTVG
jgi:hypothetical protein